MSQLTPTQQTAAPNLCDKQLSGYTFVAYGAAGDQPGRHAWHYLEPWQALPDGFFVAQWKFGPRNLETNTLCGVTRCSTLRYCPCPGVWSMKETRFTWRSSMSR